MLDIKALEAFPVLQFAVAVVLAAAGIFAIYRGTRDGRKAPSSPDPTLVFMDGPIGEGIKALHRIGMALEHAPILQTEMRERLDEIGARVSDGKRALFERIEETERREEAARRDLDSRLRAVEQECARLGARRGR
ncbi:MAG: hypothetical protein AB7V13_08305 [Pseudorhodoplanes sp.]|uniref:hypothetical protein n=1 Tax=Pseudorhodoplanes sp. TaxID=1934341 RepID=UPI003D0998A8